MDLGTCFWWVPYDLRDRFMKEGPSALSKELFTVACRMRAALLSEGKVACFLVCCTTGRIS